RVVLDEQALRRAARQCLEPECARSGEQIRDAQPFEAAKSAGQHREQRLAGAVGRWPRHLSRRSTKLPSAPLAGDNPHLDAPRGGDDLLNELRNRSSSSFRTSTAAPLGRSPSTKEP